MIKYLVKISLRGGQVIKFKCDNFNIEKNGNDLIKYIAENAKYENCDPLFYLRLDSIDHISVKRVFALW